MMLVASTSSRLRESPDLTKHKQDAWHETVLQCFRLNLDALAALIEALPCL